jgi:HEAT repeat protein
MPRETIRKLSLDVERALIAGAHLAAADPELAKDKQALDSLAQQLGDKAPVIAQLAVATAKALAASGKDAPRELVTLATMAAQVRAAQGLPAAAPKLEALPQTPEIGTPCNGKDLGDIYAALVERGKGRMEKINEAAECGDIADLRLVDALVYAMGDSWIGETVTTKAIPKLGPAIVKPIRDRINITKGRTVDGRRLRALVAVQKDGARDLLKAALTEGNSEIREAALDAIADDVRGHAEFEPLVLDAIDKEKVGGVRRAGLRALAGYGSDKSLDVLVAGLSDSRTLHAAAEGLGGSKHPKAIDTMLGKLSEAATAAAEAAKKRKGKADKDEKAKANAVGPRIMVTTLLNALAQQKHPRIASAALELLEEYGRDAAEAVVSNGDQKQLTRIADLLNGDETELFEAAVKATLKLGEAEAFKRLSAPFSAKDRGSKVGQARLSAISEAIEGTSDKRWADLALKLVAEAPKELAQYTIPLLGAFKDKRAVKPLIKILESEKNASVLSSAIDALGNIGDPAAIDPILAMYKRTDWSIRWSLRTALLEIGDESAVDKVRTIYTGLKDPNAYSNWHLRSLLQQLEQRFPGK